MKPYHVIILLSSLYMVSHPLMAEQLSPFKSDGCSLFPDGSPNHPQLWFDCCFEHDIAYWQGGNRQQKQQADQALQQCIINKTANRLLAKLMYLGVKIGGSPHLPTSFRWGYGWSYGRDFNSLSLDEIKQVLKAMESNLTH